MNTFLNVQLSPEQQQMRMSRLLLWLKYAAFIIPEIITGLLLSKYLYEYFYAPSSNNPSAVGMLISLTVFLLIFFLGVISIHDKKGLTLLVLLPGFAVVSVLAIGIQSGSVIAGSILFLLLLGVAAFAGRWEVGASVKIRFFRTGSSVIGKSMLAFAILVAFVFFDAFSTQSLGEENILFPKSAFSEITPAVSSAIKPVFGDIDLSLTLREAAENAVDSAIEQSDDRSVRYATPPFVRDQLIDQSVIEFQNRIEETLGIRVDPDKKISDAIYEGLLSKFNSLSEGARDIALLIISVVLILVIQTSSIIFRIIIIPIAFLIYELFLYFNVIRRDFEKKDKEWITLKK